MKITKKPLHLVTGIMSLGFGTYCFAVGIGVVAFELMAFSLIMLILCAVFGALYIAFGISILRQKGSQTGIFLAAGFFFSTFWWSGGVPWYIWPMVIMPWIILGLTAIILLRRFSGRNGWE